MKHILLLACVLISYISPVIGGSSLYDLESANALAIDSTDTVYFDLSNSTLIGNQLTLPVGIITNQPINSLDFSFKYDHNLLDYDTIINLTTYLQGLAYYNPSDSIVRFTSSSFTAIGVGVNLVNVKFDLLATQINGGNFSEVKGFLNGVKCTAVILNQLSVGLSDNPEKSSFSIYPNPASSNFTITASEDQVFSIVDVRGRVLESGIKIEAGEKMQFYVANLENGIYFLKAQNANAGGTRFIVQH
jgi:hypothetical protein